MLSIKLPEIAVRASGKPVDVYILEGETVFGDRCSGKMLLLSSYPKLGFLHVLIEIFCILKR